MKRTGWPILLAAGLGLFLPAARDEAPTAERMFAIPWNQDGPTFRAGGTEAVPRGPSAVALGSDGSVWILDAPSHRLLVHDRAGRRTRTIALDPVHADDLAVSPDGTLALLRLHLGRIDLLAPDGAPRGSVQLPVLVGPVRHIGFDHQGSLEVENAHGERFDLGSPGRWRSVRAVLLDRSRGPIGSTLDCGIRVEEGRTFLYEWPRSSPIASTRRPPPVVRELDLGRVAAARPVTPCSPDGLLLEVERLVGGRTSQVTREVAYVRGGQVEAVWEVALPATRLFRSFASRGAVTVMLLPLDEGVQVWRWRLP